METQDDGAFSHDEFLLVYWVHRASLKCKVQMERWDGTVTQPVLI